MAKQTTHVHRHHFGVQLLSILTLKRELFAAGLSKVFRNYAIISD
jgi:hypothetical protein